MSRPTNRSINRTLLVLSLMLVSLMLRGTTLAALHVNAAFALLLILGAFLATGYWRIARKQYARL